MNKIIQKTIMNVDLYEALRISGVNINKID